LRRGTMEVHLSADKEARLRDIATRAGKDAAALVEEAVERLLEQNAQFLEAVEEGRADARRGALLDHAEVVDRIERILRP
jgi:predicted transcriptional regulator